MCNGHEVSLHSDAIARLSRQPVNIDGDIRAFSQSGQICLRWAGDVVMAKAIHSCLSRTARERLSVVTGIFDDQPFGCQPEFGLGLFGSSFNHFSRHLEKDGASGNIKNILGDCNGGLSGIRDHGRIGSDAGYEAKFNCPAHVFNASQVKK